MPRGDLLLALKLFLPSWNFFNDFSGIPQIEFRLLHQGVSKGPWLKLYQEHSTNSLWRILYNPQGNQELLERSQLERIIEDLQKDESTIFDRHPAYSRLVRLVSLRIKAGRLISPESAPLHFQFQVRLPGETGANPPWLEPQTHLLNPGMP